MAEIYKNIPENKKRFEEFWDDVPSTSTLSIGSKETASCVSMVRKTVHIIDICKERGVEQFNIDYVRELFMDCLRGDGL